MAVRDPDPIECRECGATFNLAAQSYYDNLCPACMKEQEPERTWPMCWGCNDPVPPEQRTSVKVRGGPRDRGRVPVPVHEKCKAKIQSRQRRHVE